MFADLARTEIGRWSSGEEFVAIGRMQAITLEIILRVVFGVTDPQRLHELRPLVIKIANLDLVMVLAWRYPKLQKLPPWRGHAAAQQELDNLLYAEIASRRADPDNPGARRPALATPSPQRRRRRPHRRRAPRPADHLPPRRPRNHRHLPVLGTA